jgi:imidazolonepropionase-like amidohydrolase
MRDASGSGFIHVDKLTKFMASVSAPLAFGGTQQPVSEGRIMSVVREMELILYVIPPQTKGDRTQYYVGFHEVLIKLAARAMCARTVDKVAVQAIKQSVRTRTRELVEKHQFKLRVMQEVRQFKEMELANGAGVSAVLSTVVGNIAENLEVASAQVRSPLPLYMATISPSLPLVELRLGSLKSSACPVPATSL